MCSSAAVKRGANGLLFKKRLSGFSESHWLSLRVSSAPSGTAAKIFILIPKKIVRLATRRNRIRRLIREAVRMETFFKSAGKIYSFRVMKFPEAPRLWEVKKLIGELMEQQKQTPRTPLIRGE